MTDFDTFGQPAGNAEIDNLPAFFGGDSEDEELDPIESARRQYLREHGDEPLPQQEDAGYVPASPGSPDGEGRDESMDVGALAGIDSLLDDGVVDASAIESQILQHAESLEAEAQQTTGWNFNEFANQFGAQPQQQQQQHGRGGDPNIAVRQVPPAYHGQQPVQRQQYAPQYPQAPYGMQPPMPGMHPAQYGMMPPAGYYGMAPPGYPQPYAHPHQVAPPAQHEQPIVGQPHELQAAPSDWIGDGDEVGLEPAASSPAQPQQLSLREIQEQQALEAQQQRAAGSPRGPAAAVQAAGDSDAGAPQQSQQPLRPLELDDFRTDSFVHMPWRDLRYVINSLHRQHQAVEGQSKSHFYPAALARKAAGTHPSDLIVTSATVGTLSVDGEARDDGAKKHAKFTKWSDERSELWAKTHHTLGKYKKNDITRPVEMLHFDMSGLDRGEAGAFGDSQWRFRKVTEDAMGHILAIERCVRRQVADMQIGGIRDPQVGAELENLRANLSNVLQLRKKPEETWQILGCVQLAKGKRMVMRALAALDGVRLGIFVKLIFRNIAHFLFSRDETDELRAVNEEVRLPMSRLVLSYYCADAVLSKREQLHGNTNSCLLSSRFPIRSNASSKPSGWKACRCSVTALQPL